MDQVPESAGDDGTTPKLRMESVFGNLRGWLGKRASSIAASSCGSRRSVASLRVMDNEAELLAMEEDIPPGIWNMYLEARGVGKRRIEADFDWRRKLQSRAQNSRSTRNVNGRKWTRRSFIPFVLLSKCKHRNHFASPRFVLDPRRTLIYIEVSRWLMAEEKWRSRSAGNLECHLGWQNPRGLKILFLFEGWRAWAYPRLWWFHR